MLESVITVNNTKKISKIKLAVARWKHFKITDNKYNKKL